VSEGDGAATKTSEKDPWDPRGHVLTTTLVEDIYRGLRNLGYSPFRAGRTLRIIGVSIREVRRVSDMIEPRIEAEKLFR